VSSRFSHPPPGFIPSRIVSLVPSLTESLFALGLRSRVVGRTDWCVHPIEGVARVPRVGGTKDPDVGVIARLAPDLVIANHEKNTLRTIRQLEAQGLAVWVTYPRTVRAGAAVLAELADLGADPAVSQSVVGPVVRAVEGAERARLERTAEATRVFCPIWRDPWMAPTKDTYIHDMLELCGGRNVTAVGDRTSESRYPQLTLEEIVALRPEVVLLPDEPYAFGEADEAELATLDIPAASSGRVHRIDGTWVSWYGPRIARAVTGLRELLA